MQLEVLRKDDLSIFICLSEQLVSHNVVNLANEYAIFIATFILYLIIPVISSLKRECKKQVFLSTVSLLTCRLVFAYFSIHFAECAFSRKQYVMKMSSSSKLSFRKSLRAQSKRGSYNPVFVTY